VAALLGTYFASRAARWAITRVAERLGRKPSTQFTARAVAGIITWTLGLSWSLHLFGAPTALFVAGLSVGGAAVTTLVIKGFSGVVRDFVNGTKFVLRRPFLLGDRIMISGREYRVRDLGLQDLSLEPLGSRQGLTNFPYSQLAQEPITIFKEYSSGLDQKRPQGRLWSALVGAVRGMPKAELKGISLKAGLGVGLLAGLAALKGALALPLLDTALTVLQGGAVLFLTRQVERWIAGVIARLGERLGQSPQVILLFKFSAQALAYLAGGSITLGIFGLTWSSLLATLGASSLAVGFVVTYFLGENIEYGLRSLLTQRFTAGDTLEIAGVTGIVVDMDADYVVLEHSDKSHTLVPHALFKSPFTLWDPQTAQTAPPRPREQGPGARL